MDRRKAGQFAREMIRRYGEALVTVLVDLGDRTGLFASLAEGPGTSREIAGRAGLAERPVREWLSALASAGIVEYDPESGVFTLPPERAVCLTGSSPFNVVPASRWVSLGSKHLEELARSFQTGRGVPGDRFLPESIRVIDDLSRRRYDAALVERYLPLVPGLPERLTAGARVVDFGCGSGHATNLLAAAFPRSTVWGIDLSPEAIAAGGAEARRLGLSNVQFRVADAAAGGMDAELDLILALDTLHDQARPEEFLASAFRCLRPGGVLFAVEPRASSRLGENIGRLESPYLYGLSVLYCLPVSLAGSGAGLGTCWGSEATREMLGRVGFDPVEEREAPGNSMGSVWIAHRPSRDAADASSPTRREAPPDSGSGERSGLR